MIINPAPMIGRMRPPYSVNDVFRIVQATGANLQSAINATGLDPDLIIAKNVEASSNWIWRNGVEGLTWSLASNTDGARAAFSGYSGSQNHIAYLFKRRKDFLDVLRYDGNAQQGRSISHALGSVPGVTVVKSLSASRLWLLSHRSQIGTPPPYFVLNGAPSNEISGNPSGFAARPDTSNVYLGSDEAVNGQGEDYNAFLFGHSDHPWGVIKCASFAASGSPRSGSVRHGWPEGVAFVMLRYSGSDSFEVFDRTRSPNWVADSRLKLGESNAADAVTRITDADGTITFSNLAGGLATSFYCILIRASA